MSLRCTFIDHGTGGARPAPIYRNTSYEAGIRQATHGQSVDVMLDMAGRRRIATIMLKAQP